MNETARSGMRALVGALGTMVGLWLIPDKSSAAQVLLIGPFSVVLGGAVAGPKWAWFTGPLAYWVTIGVYEATDCAGCGAGGEEIAPPALVYLVITLTVALIAELGASAGLFLRRWLLLPPARAWVSAAAVLLVVFIAQVSLRANAVAGSSGPVVFARDGIDYRAGNPFDEIEAVRTLRDFSGEPAAWFGPKAAGFNLVQATLERRAPPNGQWNGDSLVLIYGQCSPAPCPVPLSLHITTWCRVPPEFAGDSIVGPRETLSGGVILERRAGDLVLWTGNVSITIHRLGVPAGREAELIAALRTPDGRPLPPPLPPTC